MPTNTYTPLANITLSSSASSVTFSSISQAYRDLILVVNGKVVSGSADAYMRFNSDSGTNYSRVRMSGDGSSAVSAQASSDTQGYIDSYGYLDTNFSYATLVQIMDYPATDKHKTYLSRSNNAGLGVDALAGRWASTSAITSILVGLSTGSFATGTTMSLFGVAA